MGWIGPTIAAVGQVANSAIGAASASNLNLANREWSAQQAQINRGFQEQMLQQTENYNTQMADTQMQRRMKDAAAANINPMMAATSGGAAAPMMSPPPGSMASSPSTTVPWQQGAGLAQAVTSAMQAQNLQAQTKKTISETPTPQYVTVDTDADGSQSITVNANAGHELGDQQLANQKAQIAQINSNIGLQSSQISLQQAQADVANLDATLRSDVLQGLVKAQNANNALSTTLANSGQKVLGVQIAGQNLGTYIEALRMVIGASKGN